MVNRRWKAVLYLLLFSAGITPAVAQFAPAAGVSGSTAMHRTDTRFVQWATGCTLQRGLQSVADTSLGYATVGDELSPTGAPDNGVASLGDGGVATLSFQYPIINGPGFDFAVFENGFPVVGDSLNFLELGFVEVSSDGLNFVRFASETYVQDTVQMAMAGMDCRMINNLAGKYIAGYGTPFDLEDLADSAGIDINHITHVRVIDVVGNIDNRYATYDGKGHAVNDPWPTAFASGGFDLDAVGVLNMEAPNGVADITNTSIKLYPNPVSGGGLLKLDMNSASAAILITDVNGRTVLKQQENQLNAIQLPGLSTGLYFVTIQTGTGTYNSKLLVQ